MAIRGINIKFPIEETNDGNVFGLNNVTEYALRDDMIALLTLKRGQRPMQSKMYSPIYDYIMEPMDENTESELDLAIKKKVKEFIPQITIRKIKFDRNVDPNLLGIKIYFIVEQFFGTEQTVELNIPIPNTNS
jgi:phage baseplate assembly protein W